MMTEHFSPRPTPEGRSYVQRFTGLGPLTPE